MLSFKTSEDLKVKQNITTSNVKYARVLRHFTEDRQVY